MDYPARQNRTGSLTDLSAHSVPRVTLPTVTDTDRAPLASIKEDFEYRREVRTRYILALMSLGKLTYQGTVTSAEKAARRARGKRQRAARKLSR
jgi:hypothetical protein